MKTFKQSLTARLWMVTALSLLTISGNLRALGPGVTGASAGANGGANVGTANASAIGVGSGRASGAAIGTGAHTAAAASGRSSVSFSNNTARSFAGSSVRIAPGAPTASMATNHGPQFAPTNGPSGFPSQASGRFPSAPRVGNAWTGTAPYPPARDHNRSTNPTAGYASRSFYGGYGSAGDRFTGQRLYRGAYGSGLANAEANRFMHGSRNGSDRDQDRSHWRHGRYTYYLGYGNSYPYFSGYYPYLGGYSASYGSPYLGLDGYYGLNSYSTATYGVNDPDFTAPVAPGQTDDAQQSPQGPRTDARPSSVPDNGPDSLVEAVQQELSKRGYFGGKIDAMYGADTKEALRRFQTDRHLAATGLINEATLHALQLD